jgi:hypothetical protein
MHVVITGGTGLIGLALARSLESDGHRVTVLTRDPARARTTLPAGVQAVGWNAGLDGDWPAALDGADAVVNLAGESIAGGIWTAARKRRIRESRVLATRAIVAALAAPNRPRALVNGSAVGYYGDGGDLPLPETAPAGSDFLASVISDWEREARAAEAHGVRVALIRTGIVVAREGGALPLLALPFRFFLGGSMGRPAQWVPWIHLEDEVGIIRLALEQPAASGPINAAGPEPVRMAAFSAGIGQALGRPSWLPGASIGMRLLPGGQGAVLLASQKLVPAAAQALGYRFVYPTHTAALEAALGRAGRPA